MEILKWKIKISALWIIVCINHLTFEFLDLQRKSDLFGESPQLDPELAKVVMSIKITVHCITIWLPFILRNSANKWTNVVLGLLFTAFNTTMFISGWIDWATPAAVITMFVGSLVSVLVVWCAWKFPKQEGYIKS